MIVCCRMWQIELYTIVNARWLHSYLVEYTHLHLAYCLRLDTGTVHYVFPAQHSDLLKILGCCSRHIWHFRYCEWLTELCNFQVTERVWLQCSKHATSNAPARWQHHGCAVNQGICCILSDRSKSKAKRFQCKNNYCEVWTGLSNRPVQLQWWGRQGQGRLRYSTSWCGGIFVSTHICRYISREFTLAQTWTTVLLTISWWAVASLSWKSECLVYWSLLWSCF